MEDYNEDMGSLISQRSVGRKGTDADIERKYSYDKKAKAIIADRMQWYVMNLIKELAKLSPVKTGHAANSWKFYQRPNHEDNSPIKYDVSPDDVLAQSQERIDKWDGIKPGYIINTAKVGREGEVNPEWENADDAGAGAAVKIPKGKEYIEVINEYAGRKVAFIQKAIMNCENIKGGRNDI